MASDAPAAEAAIGIEEGLGILDISLIDRDHISSDPARLEDTAVRCDDERLDKTCAVVTSRKVRHRSAPGEQERLAREQRRARG